MGHHPSSSSSIHWLVDSRRRESRSTLDSRLDSNDFQPQVAGGRARRHHGSQPPPFFIFTPCTPCPQVKTAAVAVVARSCMLLMLCCLWFSMACHLCMRRLASSLNSDEDPLPSATPLLAYRIVHSRSVGRINLHFSFCHVFAGLPPRANALVVFPFRLHSAWRHL